MLLIQIAILLVILVGVASFTYQNLFPPIVLIFLGLRSQPLPLSFFVLAALLAGILTGLLILGLLSFAKYLTKRQVQPAREPNHPKRSPWAWSGKRPEAESDNEEEEDTEDDEEDEDRGTYEVKQEPRSSQQAGSTYSYSYREASQTGVGRRESVIDAEYREVTPGYRPPEDDDDFGFDDDEFEEDTPPRGQR